MAKNDDDEIFVSLTSSGRSAETLGVTSLLGLYKVAGTHNQCKYYTQLHDLSGPGGIIFRHSADPQPWVVGKSLNDSLDEVKIKCDAEEASTAPPTQGWRSLYNKYFMLDRELKLEMMSELPPSPDVVITAEDVEGFEPCGKYKPYQEKFSSGRRVFKHESEEYFLYVYFDAISWSVRDSLDTKYALIHSASAPSLCPSDIRAARSSRRKEWQCKIDREWMNGGIRVTQAASR